MCVDPPHSPTYDCPEAPDFPPVSPFRRQSVTNGPSLFRRLLTALLGCGVLFVAAVGLVLVIGGVAVTRQPEFYTKALELPPSEAARAGEELKEKVRDVAGDVVDSPRWELRITEQQVNGWLAQQLPAEYPNLLPPGVSEPRLAFGEEQIRLACRYEGADIATVLSADVRVVPGEEPNEVHLQLVAARAGLVPIPLGPLYESLAELAERAPAEIEWDATTNPPTAQVQIPERWEEIRGRLIVDAIEIGEGQISLSGHVEPGA